MYIGWSFRLCRCTFSNGCLEVIEYVHLGDRTFASTERCFFPWEAAVYGFPNGVVFPLLFWSSGFRA